MRGAGSSPVRTAKFREVDQLVDRLVWDQEAAGSSPVFPTTLSCSEMASHGVLAAGFQVRVLTGQLN